MQVYVDDVLHGGQRSSEVKCGNLYTMAIICGQTNRRFKFKMMITLVMEVKGQQMPNVVIYVIWLPYFVRCTANTS